jgi:hypothetical protein
MNQDAEKGSQLRSRLTNSSTYPSGYVSGFVSPAALLDSHFEHPASPPLVDGKLNGKAD